MQSRFPYQVYIGVNNGGVGDEANRSLLAYSNVFNV